MSATTISSLLHARKYDLALALADRMVPVKGRKAGLEQILQVALAEGNEWLAQTALDKLRRGWTDDDRVTFCNALFRGRSADQVNNLRKFAKLIERDDKRYNIQTGSDRLSLREGRPEEVKFLSRAEMLEWLRSQFSSSVEEVALLRVVKWLGTEARQLLAKELKKAVREGDLSTAQHAAKILGGNLQSEELLAIFEVQKAKYLEGLKTYGVHDAYGRLRNVRDVAKLLRGDSRLLALRWEIGEYLKVREEREARELIDKLPADERPEFAEKLLKIQLSPSQGGSGLLYREVWSTEKLLGRDLTYEEIRGRLKLYFSSDDEVWQLELIARLPQEERSPSLEKILAEHVRMARLEKAQKVAALIPRELTMKELFVMLNQAEDFAHTASIQRTPTPGWVASSKKSIDAIVEYIISRPVPEPAKAVAV